MLLDLRNDRLTMKLVETFSLSPFLHDFMAALYIMTSTHLGWVRVSGYF